MSLNDELKKSVSGIKEMLHFGVGETFADRMTALHENAEALKESMPFVSFGSGDSIRCWPFPVPEEAGFDLFLLICDNESSFPEHKAHKYKYIETTQYITVLSGEMRVQTKDEYFTIRENESKVILPETPIRVTYKRCILFFKIAPKVDFEKFLFE